MILWYVIALVFAIMSLVTNSFGQLVAALIIGFVATIAERIDR
jgi:hypothetical protein